MTDLNPNRSSNDLPVLLLALLSLAAIMAALSGLWFFFGLLGWPLMLLAVWTGYGASARRRSLAWSLGVGLLAYVVFYTALTLAWRGPTTELTLILGLPTATSLLVYGIWPLGIFFGWLYFASFSQAVLPPERTRAFFDRFGRRS